METNIINPKTPHNGKTMAGIIVLIVGSLLLIDQLNLFFMPHWIFSWPMFIIGYGLYMGGKYNFRKPIWMWTIIIGTAFLFTENFHHADRVIWPITIIGVGTWMVLRQNRRSQVPYDNGGFKEV